MASIGVVMAEGITGPHRMQACVACRGTHITVPSHIGPHAMTWPNVVCSNEECDSYGSEMSIMRSPFSPPSNRVVMTQKVREV